MIFAVTEHSRNGLALLGDAKSLVGAERLDVDFTRHTPKLRLRPADVQQALTCLRAFAGAWCLDQSTWQGSAAVQHSWEQPSDSRSEGPISGDIGRGSYYNGS